MGEEIYKSKIEKLSHRVNSSPSEYFVTICTKGMVDWFGEVADGVVKRNDAGEIAHRIWIEIPNHHENVTLDEFVIMPNHMHGIVVLCENLGRDAINRVSTGGTTKSHNPMLSRQSLSYIVRQYKSRVSFEIRKIQPDFAWQPRFYDHIIRDEKGLNAIRDYIHNNPLRWEEDRNHPFGLLNWL